MLVFTVLFFIMCAFTSLIIIIALGIPYITMKFWQGGSMEEEVINFFKAPFEAIADLWRIKE